MVASQNVGCVLRGYHKPQLNARRTGWGGGGGGGGRLQLPKFWATQIFGQHEKFGQSLFLKKLACVCVFFRRDIFFFNLKSPL